MLTNVSLFITTTVFGECVACFSVITAKRPLLVAYLFQMGIQLNPDEGGRSSLPIIPLFDDVISCFFN